MEIDISRLFHSGDYAPMNYSASVAEIGQNAGNITWKAACDDANDFGPMLVTPKQLDAFRDHVTGFGAWSEEEIAAWSDNECNALFLQLVSGDIREADLDTDNPDWEEYYENDSVAGRMFEGIDGHIYYQLGD